MPLLMGRDLTGVGRILAPGKRVVRYGGKWASLLKRRGDAGDEATQGLPSVLSKCRHSEVSHKEKNHKMLEKNLPRRKHFPKKECKEIHGVEALPIALARQTIPRW